MSLCDKCVKRDVCYVESKDKESLVYCASYLEERPHGEWGEWDESNGYPCTNCGEYLPYSEEYDYQPDFCPNCGAEMREPEK